MSTDYELSITTNYVSNWTLNDAFRELIQNGLDQEAIDPKNEFSCSYDHMDNSVTFQNRFSHLEIKTLLLGNSSKIADSKTIGQFGEGYKIAALVLLRLGKTFKIWNYPQKEVWTASIKQSEKWKEEVLTFTIEKRGNIEGDSLEIEIGNTTYQEYCGISSIWLDFSPGYNIIETSYGNILTDEDKAGMFYVNGLFIEQDHFDDFCFGYDFKPEYAKLERDRKSCDYWNKTDNTSMMICEAVIDGKISLEEVTNLFDSEIPDIKHWEYKVNNKNVQIVAQMLLAQFDKQYPECIPVTSQREANTVSQLGGKAIKLPDTVATILKSETAKRIKALSDTKFKKAETTVKEKLSLWLNAYFNYLPGSAIDEFRNIIEKVEN